MNRFYHALKLSLDFFLAPKAHVNIYFYILSMVCCFIVCLFNVLLIALVPIVCYIVPIKENVNYVVYPKIKGWFKK